jgi:hypothetical protein
MAKICSVIVLLMVGCSSAVESQPEAKQVDTDSFISSVNVQAKAIVTTLAAQKLTGEMTLENTQSIITKLNKLEASLGKSEPQNGKDGDPASAPEPPAKANTQQAPLKVATPGASSRIASDGTVLKWNIEGNWNPTILETSAHLRTGHGIDTNGMTHQEMADLHAALHDGKPVAMKSKPVQFVSRGSSCPGGVCPTNTRQRRGLFGWRR